MKRFRPILVLMALLVAVAALVASGSDDEAKKADDNGSVSDDDGGASDSGDSAPETFKVGDAVELGDWAVKVHSFTDPVEVAEDSFAKPEEGFRRVKVDAEVTNNSDEPTTVSSLICFELKDGENKTYDQTVMADSSVGSIDGEVAPGDSLRGEIAYDVPTEAQGFTFNFKCDLLSTGSAAIELS